MGTKKFLGGDGNILKLDCNAVCTTLIYWKKTTLLYT